MTHKKVDMTSQIDAKILSHLRLHIRGSVVTHIKEV